MATYLKPGVYLNPDLTYRSSRSKEVFEMSKIFMVKLGFKGPLDELQYPVYNFRSWWFYFMDNRLILTNDFSLNRNGSTFEYANPNFSIEATRKFLQEDEITKLQHNHSRKSGIK